MTRTGTVAGTSFTNRELIEAAFRRCRLPAQVITPEKVTDTLGELHRILQSLPARVIPLWAQEKVLLGLIEGASQHALPIGTIDVVRAKLRTYTRLTGTGTSTAGGTPSLALDEDLTTACTQTSPDGSLTVDLASSLTFSVVALAMSEDVTLNILFEGSDDDSTYTTIVDLGEVTFEAGILQWFELDPQVTRQYVRVSTDDGSALDVLEFFIGNNPTETSLTRVNHDQFIATSTPEEEGMPTRYWVDRQVDGPVMHVHPKPSSDYAFSCAMVWTQREIMDVGTLTQSLEIPPRWYDALVAILGYRVALNTPEVPLDLVNLLKPEAVDALNLISSDERDSSPARLRVNLSRYTR
jgi:hypothetical protein